MFSETAVDPWLWQHAFWGAIYACVFLRWGVAYGFMLSWEVWEAVGRRLIPDDGIFGPESWTNIALDVVVAALAYHATAWLLQGLPRAWTHADPAGAVVPMPMRPKAPAPPAEADAVPDNV